MKILAAGALPRPDNKDRITPDIKLQNESTTKSCRRMRKRPKRKIDVTFIAAYKIFLERFKIYDEQKDGIATHIRIIRRIDKYYCSSEAPIFNNRGADKLYNYILQRLHRPHLGPIWIGMPVVTEMNWGTDLRDDKRDRNRGQPLSQILHEIDYTLPEKLVVPVTAKPYTRPPALKLGGAVVSNWQGDPILV